MALSYLIQVKGPNQGRSNSTWPAHPLSSEWRSRKVIKPHIEVDNHLPQTLEAKSE